MRIKNKAHLIDWEDVTDLFDELLKDVDTGTVLDHLSKALVHRANATRDNAALVRKYKAEVREIDALANRISSGELTE
jgi:hypothetical protein